MKQTIVTLREQIETQRRWIYECGRSRAGYISRYGSASDLDYHGDGGEAIYEADRAQLKKLENELAAVTRGL